ncbi:MAG TPA: hypothetical protein VKB27_16235 [Gammaproteobacteria bacterium]|nr:hypothetical protein [Gammaproteobacteria bacterium]
MSTQSIIESAEFERPQKSRISYFWITPAALLFVYYLYLMFNGWGVQVVEFRPSECQLVNNFGSPNFKYRKEGILELKSRAASLGADTLYAPYPRDSAHYGAAISEQQYVYVPAWAYRCHS